MKYRASLRQRCMRSMPSMPSMRSVRVRPSVLGRIPLATLAGLLGLALQSGPAQAAEPRLLDDFEVISGWTAHPASGVDLNLVSDPGLNGRALRMDFRFSGGGYAVARRSLDVELPENYAFSFQLRGQAPVNHLEFKLLDASGENVWWFVRRDQHFPSEWQRFTVKKRQISFAWGPAGGGEIPRVAAIEFVVTAGSGGEGSLWIDDFQLHELPPAGAALPEPLAEASSFLAPFEPSRAIDGDTLTAWVAGPGDAHPVLTLDLTVEREFGGLVLDWAPERHPAGYSIEISPDRLSWSLLRVVRRSNGGRDRLLLTESEGRYLRIQAETGLPAEGIALREIGIQPLAWGESAETFFRTLAQEAPRGAYPRSILGEPVCWTVVGTDDGHPAEGLMDEDGRLEIAKAGPSIEPFLFLDGRLLSWNDFDRAPRLEGDDLPVPVVQWTRPGLELTITAFALAGDDTESRRLLGLSPVAPGLDPQMIVRYRLRNTAPREQQVRLFLALRPFQANPPAQFLNTPGGTAVLRQIERDGTMILCEGRPTIAALTPFDAFGAATFDEGDLVTDYLQGGRLPATATTNDPFQRASAALAYDLSLSPGASAEAALRIPLERRGEAETGVPAHGSGGSAGAFPLDPGVLDQLQAAVIARWQAHRRGIVIEVPSSADDLVKSLWAQLGYILINRDGAGIQPGSRSYERSWIRDGALTSTALLRLGHPEVVREFLLWFASHQYPDGKVPCCIDHRGADPVPEHDSHGELIYLAAEYVRYTGDLATAREVWPALELAAAYIDTLRGERRTLDYTEPGMEHFYGLLPPSISHEGYSAKPMHSYWDDFWAYRGLKDAAFLAEELGESSAAARISASRDQ